jgi:hypothetical protein
MNNMNERVANISSREELIAFIEVLHADLKDRPEKWENPTLDRFLGALASWTRDMDGYYAYKGETTPEVPTWRTFGEMLVAARIYE